MSEIKEINKIEDFTQMISVIVQNVSLNNEFNQFKI